MQLILGLLRIIGILILAVLLLVLVVLLLVLLCPVRYKAAVTRELSDPPKGYAKATWFLHLLSVRVDYNENLDYRIKVLGFTLLKGQDVLDSENRDGDEETFDKASDESVSESEPVTTDKDVVRPTDKSLDQSVEGVKPKISEKAVDTKAEERNVDNSRLTIAERVAELLQKLADFIEKIFGYPELLLEKLDEWQQKKEKWLKYFQDEQHRAAVKAVFGTTGSVLMHLKPRKLRIDGRLGFDDPAVTGQVFGLIGMLMPLYGETIHLEAVFDRAVAEGSLEAQGRIRFGTLVYLLIRLIGKKEVRRLITQVKGLKRHK